MFKGRSGLAAHMTNTDLNDIKQIDSIEALGGRVLGEWTSRLGALHNELGFVDGLLYAADRLVQSILGRRFIVKYHLYSQPVIQRELLSARRGAKISVRKLSAEDPVLAVFPRPKDVFTYRFRQKALCFVAYKHEKPVGFLWVVFGSYFEDEVRCKFYPQPCGKAAWDFDIYIFPEERTSLCFARLWDAVNHFLKEQGCLYTASRVSAFNRLSQHSHQRLGAKRVGTATFFLLASWQLSLFSEWPFIHFSISKKRYPKIYV